MTIHHPDEFGLNFIWVNIDVWPSEKGLEIPISYQVKYPFLDFSFKKRKVKVVKDSSWKARTLS
jgi:hypothetical protein